MKATKRTKTVAKKSKAVMKKGKSLESVKPLSKDNFGFEYGNIQVRYTPQK